ncbi:hypothetical protein OG563_07205 [Nocardia vinacea]|uniref:Uncharacterized protein n=1 Tax=Nocardia vinacea TaxID=96468 RepID=A0ABZ1Z1M0_9NOCA|nr:hypothetical protein [Nocardia vinacea]
MNTPFAVLPDTGLDTIQNSAQAGFVLEIFADSALDTIQDSAQAGVVRFDETPLDLIQNSAQAGVSRSILPGDLDTYRTAE